jgi:hypothetical protein
VGDENDNVHFGESVYTQISKEMLVKDRNIKANKIYDRLTNESIFKAVVERRSASVKAKKVVQRLYSPVHKIGIDEITYFNPNSFKNQSFSSNPNKSVLIKNKFLNDKTMINSVINENNYKTQNTILQYNWNSADQLKNKVQYASMSD